MYVIGLDIGTTSICGIIMDAATGHVILSKTVSSNAFVQTSHTWEKIQNVSKITEIVKQILNTLLASYPDNVIAIGITGQMHGIVYVDQEGHAVSPLYTWQDSRGNLSYQGTTYADYLHSFSGYGNVTDFYNRINGLVPKNAITYCTIHAYIAMMLCKNVSPILHVSDAASLGLYDLKRQKFEYDCTVPVTDASTVIGYYQNIPVALAIGDNQASVLSALSDENDLLLNIGTGSQVSIVSKTPIIGDNLECRPYINGKYLIVGAALCGGRAYALLKNFYQEVLESANMHNTDIDVYRLMQYMIKEKNKTTLKVDTRFDGTRTDISLKGSIQNITTNNLTPADLTLGFIYGIVEELHDMYITMGVHRQKIVGSGNGIRHNQALISAAEEVFDKKIHISPYTEEAACGAALFALSAIQS